MPAPTAAPQPTPAPFKATPGQIKAAELLYLAMAQEQLVRPVVEAYETAILARHQFSVAPEWAERYDSTSLLILDRKRSYLLSDADAEVFYRECREAREASGLTVESPGFCPLCVAENLKIQAENALLSAMAEVQGLEAFARPCALTLEQRAQVIDLSLRLITPSIRNGAEILHHLVHA
ncbi:conserved hypothetical protein [Paraburkholderia tropica]|nr:hypothetical protein [Paraburkholderia tropica]CAG9236928.1 conserved hypothetical protein [Paraburkholderia tropica]